MLGMLIPVGDLVPCHVFRDYPEFLEFLVFLESSRHTNPSHGQLSSSPEIPRHAMSSAISQYSQNS